MSTLKFETYGGPEIVINDCGQNFKSGFLRSRHPLERVEFDEWAQSLEDFDQFVF